MPETAIPPSVETPVSQPNVTAASPTADLAALAMANPEQMTQKPVEASNPDLNSTLYTGAVVGTQIAGAKMMFDAAGNTSQSQASASAAVRNDATTELAVQSILHTPDETVAEVPAAKSELFKQWRLMVQNLAAAYKAAEPHMDEEARKQWGDSLKQEETFALTAADFGNPKKIEDAFIAEAGKTSLKVAEERFANIAIALNKLRDNPAASVTFFRNQHPPHLGAHCSDKDEFSAKQWVQEVTLNKEGINTDLSVKEALQNPEPRLALEFRPNGKELLADVDILAKAAQEAIDKMRTAHGEKTMTNSWEAELPENKGKSAQEIESLHLSRQIIKGLKLIEPEAKANGAQLKDVATFLHGLPESDIAPFIRSLCKENDQGFSLFGDELPRLGAEDQFVKMIETGNAQKWAEVKAAFNQEQNALRDQFKTLVGRGSKALQGILKDNAPTAHIFEHGVGLEQLPEVMQNRMTEYLDALGSDGMKPKLEKDNIEKLGKLVGEWEQTATSDQHARDAWVEKQGDALIPNVRRMAEGLQSIFIHGEANENWLLQPNVLFGQRLQHILSRTEHPKNKDNPQFSGPSDVMDFALSAEAFKAFGSTNAEREAKLEFLEKLKPHELDAVMDKIGFGVHDASAAHPSIGAQLAKLATPEGFAALNVHEAPKPEHKPEHEKPGHEPKGHELKPPHETKHHEPMEHSAVEGHASVHVDPTGSQSAPEAVSQQPPAIQSGPNPDMPKPPITDFGPPTQAVSPSAEVASNAAAEAPVTNGPAAGGFSNRVQPSTALAPQSQGTTATDRLDANPRTGMSQTK